MQFLQETILHQDEIILLTLTSVGSPGTAIAPWVAAASTAAALCSRPFPASPGYVGVGVSGSTHDPPDPASWSNFGSVEGQSARVWTAKGLWRRPARVSSETWGAHATKRRTPAPSSTPPSSSICANERDVTNNTEDPLLCDNDKKATEISYTQPQNITKP